MYDLLFLIVCIWYMHYQLMLRMIYKTVLRHIYSTYISKLNDVVSADRYYVL